MNDRARWGPAKSFFMAGQAAGFDMTDQDQMNLFAAAYNASLAGLPLPDDIPSELLPAPLPIGPGRREDRKEKKRRKMSKASRRKNRRT